MLDININDVLMILQNMIPQFIILGIIFALAVIAMVACYKLSKPVKYAIRSNAVVAMIAAVVIFVNYAALGQFSSMLSLVTGDGTISNSTQEEAGKLANTIMQEGIVLLKNDDNFLPMKDQENLNVFGWASTNPVYGGTGSGSLSDNYPKVSLLEGLSNSNFKTNTELSDFYVSYMSERPAPVGILTPNLTLPEPPVKTYSDELIDGAKNYSDTALIVLGRIGGEGADLVPDMGAVIDGSYKDGSSYKDIAYTNNSDEYDDFARGESYLELSRTERDMVDLVCKMFPNVVVVYNGANTLELGWVNDYEQIKSVIWCPGTGQSGFNALGEVLRGTVNPSGRTTDTFVYDLTKTPTFNNIGCFIYDNMEEYIGKAEVFGAAIEVYPSFVNYVQKINQFFYTHFI